MKLNYFIGITTKISLIFSSLFILDSYPALATSVKFECADRAIAAVTPDAERTSSLISFNFDYFSSSGYSPEVQCNVVAERLNQALTENGESLNNFYLTTGIVNRLPVICYVFNIGEPCNSQNVLLTVPLGTNANQVLEDMLGIRQSAGGPFFERSESSISLNFGKYIQQQLYGNDQLLRIRPTGIPGLLGDPTTDAPGPEGFDAD